MWSCGPNSVSSIELAVTAEISTTVEESLTTSTSEALLTTQNVVMTSYTTLFISSSTGGPPPSIAPDPPSSTYTEAAERDDIETTSDAGVIAGGIVGGTAAVGLAVAVVVVLVRRRRTASHATRPSFRVIGTNISAPLPQKNPLDSPKPASRGSPTTPQVAEVDGHNWCSTVPSETAMPIYQPYRRQPNDSKMSVPVDSNALPHSPEIPAFLPPKHSKSNPSLMPISEVDGTSTPKSQESMGAPEVRHDSRYAELEAFQMSTRPGSVPGWNATELP